MEFWFELMRYCLLGLYLVLVLRFLRLVTREMLIGQDASDNTETNESMYHAEKEGYYETEITTSCGLAYWKKAE